MHDMQGLFVNHKLTLDADANFQIQCSVLTKKGT